MNAITDVRGLTKRFGEKLVVDHIDLQVERGRIHGFLGPNGSGKTTTIRMLCGLLTPDEGEGTCLGFDIRREAAAIKRQVGYMTQRFGLYEDLSIAENLDFIGRMYALPGRKARVDAALAEAGLAGRLAAAAGLAVRRAGRAVSPGKPYRAEPPVEPRSLGHGHGRGHGHGHF